MTGKALLVLTLAFAAVQAASIFNFKPSLKFTDGKITELDCIFDFKHKCHYKLDFKLHNATSKIWWSADYNLTSIPISQKDTFCLTTFYNVSHGDTYLKASFLPGPVTFIDVPYGQGTGKTVKNVVKVTPGSADFQLQYSWHDTLTDFTFVYNMTAVVTNDCDSFDQEISLV